MFVSVSKKIMIKIFFKMMLRFGETKVAKEKFCGAEKQ